MQLFCLERDEITPFGGNDFNMSAKWLSNDVEWSIITELEGRSAPEQKLNVLYWTENQDLKRLF